MLSAKLAESEDEGSSAEEGSDFYPESKRNQWSVQEAKDKSGSCEENGLRV